MFKPFTLSNTIIPIYIFSVTCYVNVNASMGLHFSAVWPFQSTPADLIIKSMWGEEQYYEKLLSAGRSVNEAIWIHVNHFLARFPNLGLTLNIIHDDRTEKKKLLS